MRVDDAMVCVRGVRRRVSPVCLTSADRPVTTAHWEKVGAKTEAGPDVTTRRIVAPKPGLVGHGSGGYDRSMDAEGYLRG